MEANEAPAAVADTGPLVLFDGVCTLCSGSVQFLDRRATRELWYASMQSATGQSLLLRYGLSTDDYDSFVFLEEGRLHFKSEAALRLVHYMKMPWPWLHVLGVVPRAPRDWIYDRIARNRYSLFGKRQACMVPAPGLAAKFLE